MASIDSITIGSGVRGIIFDYGGTLDSRGDHWSHIILDGYRHAGVRIPTDAFIDAYIHAERALEARSLIDPADDFRTLMRKKIAIEMERLVERGDISAAESGKSERIADFCYEQARGCVAESAVTLAGLAGDYPLALVSNFYGNLRAVTADFGIDGYFKAIVESAVVGMRKPDPGMFRLGIEALGLSADEVLVVGDSMSKDILPARSLGCMTTLIEGRPWPPGE